MRTEDEPEVEDRKKSICEEPGKRILVSCLEFLESFDAGSFRFRRGGRREGPPWSMASQQMFYV